MPEAPQFISPMDVVPTSGPSATAYATVLRSLPSILRDLMTDMGTVDLINGLRDRFHLNDAQREQLAVFLRDVLIGLPLSDDISGDLAAQLGVDAQIATQIVREIESTVLARAGMSLASISRTYEGPTVIQDGGELRLRYTSVDDIFASIESLTSDERMLFLNEAKQDNRILVLKALSQLKLGTDQKGKPVPFSTLVDREAPDFDARDWVDISVEGPEHLQQPAVREALMTFVSNSDRLTQLVATLPNADTARLFHRALQEALGGAKPALVAHVRLSPYFAGVFDREQGVSAEQFDKFASLPDEARQRLVSSDLSGRIEKLVQEGVVPDEYAVAVAKTVFLVEVGDISSSSLADLFGKRLGLTPEQGGALAKRIRTELLTEEPAPDGEESPLVSVPAKPEAPPVSEPEPASAMNPEKPKRPERSNVVDLRQRS